MLARRDRGARVSALGVLAVAGAAAALLPGAERAAAQSAMGTSSDPHAGLPERLSLTGVVRDFRERSVSGGHPDFERQPARGFGHYARMVGDNLDADGKPVFAGTGRKVTTQFRDSAGRNVSPPRPHLQSRTGDQGGVLEAVDGGAVTDASTFAQWWRDVPGTNVSRPLTLSLVRQPGTNIYTFNDRTDPDYSRLGGFFPVNGELFGNSRNDAKNFHFTFELDTRFVYRRGAGQVFTFVGDDDVYVFVNGKCVIDLGGVHGAISQTIELDRIAGLEDGKMYPLKFFFAERHRTQSNFRIETTLNLMNADLPTTSALYD